MTSVALCGFCDASHCMPLPCSLDPQCSYCQQSHPSARCTTVTTLDEHKQILKTSGRCFNCLRRRHVSHDCRSSSRCQKCKRKHHTSICDAGSNQSPRLSLAGESGLNLEVTPFRSARTTSTLCSDGILHVPPSSTVRVTHTFHLKFDSFSMVVARSHTSADVPVTCLAWRPHRSSLFPLPPSVPRRDV